MPSIPNRVTNLATEIAKSWRQEHNTKFIVIAPPFSEPHRLFNLLADRRFLSDTLKEKSSQIATARLGEQDFVESRFLRKMAVSWGCADAKQCPDEDLMIHLNNTIERLKEKEQIPVLLVERFHSGLTQLDRDFGVQLRELENHYRLNTVYELPIKIRALRAQLKSTTGGCPFLQSDWGQGYRDRNLLGYTLDEIKGLHFPLAADSNAAASLMTATAGLPDLINSLMPDLEGLTDRNGLERILRARATETCDRLLDWIEPRGENTFKNLLRRSLTEHLPNHLEITLKKHSWAPWLLDKDDSLRFRMLAWASTEALEASRETLIPKTIFERVEAGEITGAGKEAKAIADGGGPRSDLWRSFELLCRFFSLAIPTELRWPEAHDVLEEHDRLASSSNRESIRVANDTIKKWKPLANLMVNLLRGHPDGEPLRIGEKVCSRAGEPALRAYVQLLRYHLLFIDKRYASRQIDAHAARSAINSHPESILQLYCWLKLGVRFWKHIPLPNTAACRFLGREMAPPSAGKRLDFMDLLFLIQQKLESLPANDRLFDNSEGLEQLYSLYTNSRSVQSHEFTLVSDCDWRRYYSTCSGLTQRFWTMFQSIEEPLELPGLSVCLAPLKEELLKAQ